MWTQIAAWFDIKPEIFKGSGIPLELQLADASPIWQKIAQDKHLVEPTLTALTSPWHTDADLGLPIEVVTDMSKSRKLGFFDYQATNDSFFDLFATLRSSHLIP